MKKYLPRSGRSRSTARLLLGGLFFAIGAVGAAAGCGEGKTCEEGGGVVIDGKCEGKCDNSKCLENNVCAHNRCVLQCTKLADCAEGQECLADTGDDGSAIMSCQFTEKSEYFQAPCPKTDECGGFSTCADGKDCLEDPTACPAEECKPMACLGGGIGDAYAYCTGVDCKAAEDCPSGMECRPTAVKNKICGTTKGTVDPCIDPANFTANGGTYQEGPQSLLQNMCAKRGDCAPCQTDIDCELEADQQCVQIGPDTRCARHCNVAKDCEDDHNCVGASADGPGFCVPKFGACVGNGNFCEPCHTDLDCAAGGPTSACISLQGTQTACFDLSFPDTCTSDANCPTSPSGKHGHCIQAGEGFDASLTHRCFVPIQASTGKAKCW
jgi:hypothetical protein